MGPEILSSTGAGVWRKAPKAFPDSNTVLDKFQSATVGFSPNQSAVVSTKRRGVGPYPQYGWDFPEEIPEEFRKDPGNALRAFPGIPLTSTAGMPQTLQLKAFEASRAFPEFSPPPVRLGMPLFSEVVPERASQSRSWNSQQCWG